MKIKTVCSWLKEIGILLLAYYTTVTLFSYILFSQHYPEINTGFFVDAQSELRIGNRLVFVVILTVFAYGYNHFFCSSASRHFYISTFLFAVIFAFFHTVGLSQYISSNQLFRLPARPRAFLLMTAVTLIFCYCFTELINSVLDKRGERLCFSHEPEFRIKRFFFFFTIFFLAWLPYVVINYPGSVSYDGKIQLYMTWGVYSMSNNNPIFDTMIYGILFRVGAALCGTDNAGVAFAIFFQLLLFSLSFGFFAETFYEISQSPTMTALLIFFYAINPIFGGAAQIILKDSLHMCFFVLYVTFLIRLSKSTMTRKKMFPLFVLFLTSALSRKASFPYILSAALLLTFLLRNHKPSVRMLMISIFLSVLGYSCIEMVIIPLAGIDKGLSREYLALPIQVVSYITKQNYASMSQEQLNQINELINIETIINRYDPNLADAMKVAFAGRGRHLLRIFLQLSIQYPLDFIKGVVTCTWKYFFSFAAGNEYCRSYISDFSYGKNIYYAFPEWHEILLEYTNSWGSSSALFMLVSPGFYDCLLLFTLARTIRNKQKDFGLWIGLCPLLLLLAGLFFTPLNGETRYAFPIIAMSPALFLWTIRSKPQAAIP